MTPSEFIRRCLCMIWLTGCIVVAVLLTGCQSPTVRTTTTRTGITGAQETVVTETPYEEPFDRMLSETGAQLMATDFHP